jgi:hypothetical protein
LNRDFRRHAFSSLAAVKQKAKEGLERLGRGIVLRFSKTQPRALLVFVCGWIAPAALEEKKAFVSRMFEKY